MFSSRPGVGQQVLRRRTPLASPLCSVLRPPRLSSNLTRQSLSTLKGSLKVACRSVGGAAASGAGSGGSAWPAAGAGAAAAVAGGSLFELFKVTGDGACMFRAIVQGATISSGGKPLTREAETSAAAGLRRNVVAELARRRMEIEPFIPGILDGDVTFEAYLARMSHPAAWGGEPEMVMAVNVLRRPIVVWRLVEGNAEKIVTYGEELDVSSGAAINLLWHRLGHYDLLVMKRGV